MAEPKLILIVDDDRDLVDGLRSMLERQGHRVIQAHDGNKAKQTVYEQKPDLMILDMMMPKMGGYPVLEHFKGKADAPPIIMITANEGSRHKAYAEYLGVVEYIRKPFAVEKLLDAVAKAFAIRKQHQNRRLKTLKLHEFMSHAHKEPSHVCQPRAWLMKPTTSDHISPNSGPARRAYTSRVYHSLMLETHRQYNSCECPVSTNS